MGDGVRILAKTERSNIRCFPFIDRASHLILEGYQVGEAQFPCLKSNHPLVLGMFGNCFQEYSLHHLLRDRGKAYQPEFSWILSFDDRSDVCKLPVLRNRS